MMQFASSLSTSSSPVAAIDDAASTLSADLLAPAHLVVAFCTPHHAPGRSGLAGALAKRFPDAVVVGCTAGGVLGAGVECEGTAGLALLGAHLPGVDLHPFHLDRALMGGPEEIEAAIADVIRPASRGLMVLSDPYSFDLGPFLEGAHRAAPDVPIFGGQASGGASPGPHELLLRDRVVPGGLVGLSFEGDIHIETRVAQGCRPVGPPMFVTSCADNRILELDGGDPIAKLKEVYEALPPLERALFRDGQLIGIQMRDQDEYGTGDFLVRHVLGVPKGQRGLAVAGQLERYAVVQLQVRDRTSAHDDLVERLTGLEPPAGALLFSCLGRGRGLYGEPHHDSRTFLEEVGPTPIAGFFANGEIGPVHGTPFVHGYTSVFALFTAL